MQPTKYSLQRHKKIYSRQLTSEFVVSYMEIHEMMKHARIVDCARDKKELMCKICTNLMLDPMECKKCSATFCSFCINHRRFHLKNKTCPECDASSMGIQHNKNLEDYLKEQLMVKCTHDNCLLENISISYTEFISSHAKQCYVKTVKCPMNCG